MTDRLETARLVLRRPNASDWPAARAFLTSDRASGIGGPFELGRAWRMLAAEIGHWEMLGYGMWAVTRRDDDTALALIGPWNPADWPEPELGWSVWDQSVEGTGIATEAARAAINHAWSVLGWQTMVSYITPENARSIRLAEKLGAIRDDAATPPALYNPCLVYRHPKPEATA